MALWGERGVAAGAGAVGPGLQTGGGEVLWEALSRVDQRPETVAASESCPPNLELARANLRSFAEQVVDVGDEADLPFPAEHFELVISRHPTFVRWNEVARVLRPRGVFFSQQVGPWGQP